MTIEITEDKQEFLYMYLDRMRSDCNFYLGYGNRNKHYLAEGENQIEKMKEIWKQLKIKPEWLTMKQIEKYEIEMQLK